MTEIFELPLFPLNTVLFPGMYLPLHVFEDRYKQLVGACLAEDRPFGVVCIREGVAEQGPLPVPHAIGCTAEIVQMRSLSEGRMYLVTVGQERFRILSLSDERPYLVGEVELLPFAEDEGTTVTRAADSLYPLVIDYLEILSRLGDVEIDKNPDTHRSSGIGGPGSFCHSGAIGSEAVISGYRSSQTTAQ